jgi:DNA-binding MarR family transcriptional regulator
MPADQLASSPVMVWRSLMQVHAGVLQAIEAELQTRHDLSVSEFDALVNLPADGARHQQLAERVILSRSALTRLVDRLESRGLVTRQRFGSDLRGVRICLTEPGRRLRREAARTNARVVRREFGDRLGADDTAALAHILHRLRE